MNSGPEEPRSNRPIVSLNKTQHYASKEGIDRFRKAQKRNANGECIKVIRLRTWAGESGAFEYKRDSLFCCKDCLPRDGKHPDRWDRVCECLTKDRVDNDGNPLLTMKDMILDIAEQRNCDAVRRAKLHIALVSDLPSAECKNHARCYNNFMQIPKYANLSTGITDENAMKQVIELITNDQRYGVVLNSIPVISNLVANFLILMCLPISLTA